MLLKSPPPVEVKRSQRNCFAIFSCRKIRLPHTQQKNDHSSTAYSNWQTASNLKDFGVTSTGGGNPEIFEFNNFAHSRCALQPRARGGLVHPDFFNDKVQ